MVRLLCRAFWLLVAVTATLPGQALQWSIHVHPGLLAGLSREEMAAKRVSPLVIPERLRDPHFPERLDLFLDLCLKNGISEVVVDGIQPELKGIYFRSEIMEKQGWKPLFDLLELLRDRAAAKNIGLGVSLTEVGIHARGLYEGEPGLELEQVQKMSASDLEPFLAALIAKYRLRSISEEEFPSSWFPLVQALGDRHGFRYLHRANTDDIVSLAGVGERTTPLEAYAPLQILGSRDYFPLLAPGHENGVVNGSLPLLFPGSRKTIETSPWFSGWLFMQNAAAFRALQFGPDQISLLAGPQELEALDGAFFQRVRELRAAWDPSIPELNLVVAGKPQDRLDAGHVGWLQLVANLEPILLGAGAAGMRPVVSGKPRPGAAAYYIYLAGPGGEEWIELERFLAERKDTPVIVQMGSAVSEQLLWRILGFLGISGGEWKRGTLPALASYRSQTVAFQGPDLYQGNVATGWLDFPIKPQSLLMADSSLTPLIHRHPEIAGRFFVNGNLLHREMAFPISQLLTDGKGLQRPAACFIAVGKKTAFWALRDTEVDWVDPRTGARLVLAMKKNGFHLE